jgi:hypothetical protein
MQIDLSLRNSSLYDGCKIGEVAGRLNLETPPAEAANIVGRNIAKMIEAVPAGERAECVLTGPMAVWAYLVVFHAVVHCFTKVKYADGRGDPILISQHGS